MRSPVLLGGSYPAAGLSRRRRRLVTQMRSSRHQPKAEGAVADPPLESSDQTVVIFEPAHHQPAVSQGRASPLPAEMDFDHRLCSCGPIRRLLRSRQPVTWVFTGDSIAHGEQYTRGYRSYSEHFAERVRWELRRFPDVVINTGVSGETSAGLLNHLTARTVRFSPDVVSVMVGMNDAKRGKAGRVAFRRNLHKIIDRLRQQGAIVLLHTPNRIDWANTDAYTDLRAYVKIIRETARELNVACVDHWAHWKEASTRDDGWKEWLAEDGIHPGIFGHREIAKLIFTRLGIFDETSPTCNTPLS